MQSKYTKIKSKFNKFKFAWAWHSSAPACFQFDLKSKLVYIILGWLQKRRGPENEDYNHENEQAGAELCQPLAGLNLLSFDWVFLCFDGITWESLVLYVWFGLFVLIVFDCYVMFVLKTCPWEPNLFCYILPLLNKGLYDSILGCFMH